MVLSLYRSLLTLSPPVLRGVLAWRQSRGKEDPLRLYERMGLASLARPAGKLVWIHAASVGEAQSALILLDHMADTHVLITSGTVTSAKYLSARLPAHAIHQYVPLDAPQWASRFLDHWKPDLALWMESELWPNMLMTLKARGIPAALVNARLSDTSFRHWQYAPASAGRIVNTFDMILAQTQDAAQKYKQLGAHHVVFTDNLKYSAAPLPANDADVSAFMQVAGSRPRWVYASTHDGEEQLAARVHARLLAQFPDLLTVIVPRHPERRAQIAQALSSAQPLFRGDAKQLPQQQTGLYIADTLGELGLFYRAAPIAVIGRSFSDDGGGGHNPIEAAQLDCAVLSGPHVQYQQALFDEMCAQNAARLVQDEDALYGELMTLLSQPDTLSARQKQAAHFAAHKTAVIDTVMTHLAPLLDRIR